MADPSQVVSLHHTVTEIEELYEKARSWLEEQERNYVLAVPETHAVWIAGQSQPVGLVAALLPPDAWTVLSAGEGSQKGCPEGRCRPSNLLHLFILASYNLLL